MGKALKKMLREKYLKLRRQMRKEAVGESSARICDKLVSSKQFEKARAILFYYPVKNEVNCLPAMQEAFGQGKKVFLPRVRGWDFEIVEVKNVKQLKKLKVGELGIPEPSGRKVPLEEIGLVVVPGVAFDLQGHRIGYGGGYYDELFKNKSGKLASVGLCYAKMLLKKIPFEGHDQRVDYISCENKLIDCRRKKE